eukprot:217779_1
MSSWFILILLSCINVTQFHVLGTEDQWVYFDLTVIQQCFIRITHVHTFRALSDIIHNIPDRIKSIRAPLNATITNDVNRLYQHSFKRLGMIGANRRDLCRLLDSMMEQNKLMHINMHLSAWNAFLQQYFGIPEPFHNTPKSCVCRLLGVMQMDGSSVVPDVNTFNIILLSIVENDVISLHDAAAALDLVTKEIMITDYGIVPNARTVEAWMILYAKQKKYIEGVILLRNLCAKYQINDIKMLARLLIKLFQDADAPICNQALDMFAQSDRYLMLEIVMPYHGIKPNNKTKEIFIEL